MRLKFRYKQGVFANFLGLHIVNILCTIAVISRIPQHILNYNIDSFAIKFTQHGYETCSRLIFFIFFLQQILQSQKAVSS